MSEQYPGEQPSIEKFQQQEPQAPKGFWPFVLYILGRLRLQVRHWARKVLPKIEIERQAKVQVQLRDSSEPDFDYFVLVVLAASIATFGLLTDSPATIIGAMLVAPLMSPILGIGLGSIKGDAKLLRDAGSALLRGALLAILLALLITLANSWLPFISLEDIPTEGKSVV